MTLLSHAPLRLIRAEVKQVSGGVNQVRDRSIGLPARRPRWSGPKSKKPSAFGIELIGCTAEIQVGAASTCFSALKAEPADSIGAGKHNPSIPVLAFDLDEVECRLPKVGERVGARSVEGDQVKAQRHPPSLSCLWST